jgi:hypothetical protein
MILAVLVVALLVETFALSMSIALHLVRELRGDR